MSQPAIDSPIAAAGTSRTPLSVNEWQQVSAKDCRQLSEISGRDLEAIRPLVERLRGRVNVSLGFAGLGIETTSFVGCIDVGPLRISIRPKLPAVPLTQLFRYAYGLSDLALVNGTEIPVEQLGLEELLILMLVQELELLSCGRLVRHYVARQDCLASPRGSLLMREIIRRGGIAEARLPCRPFERDLNWHLNQVLHSGIRLAASRALDHNLRRRAIRAAESLFEVDLRRPLLLSDLDRAEQCLTRMTAIYQPALALIRLLCHNLGPRLESTRSSAAVPGFLFDMNVFFQRLVLRYLQESGCGFRIDDERPIRDAFAHPPGGNPRKRLTPKPRPDYTLTEKGEVRGFLDAKYRDLWRTSLPAHWVYQLGIYALNSPTRASVLLYATMSEEACEECLEVRSPVAGIQEMPARILIRPVILSELLGTLGGQGIEGARARRRLAERLVSLNPLSVRD